MVRQDAGFLKSQRIKEITKKIAANIKHGVSVDKTLDWIEVEMGLTRQKAGEYLALVVKIQGWIRDEDTIFAEVPA